MPQGYLFRKQGSRLRTAFREAVLPFSANARTHVSNQCGGCHVLSGWTQPSRETSVIGRQFAFGRSTSPFFREGPCFGPVEIRPASPPASLQSEAAPGDARSPQGSQSRCHRTRIDTLPEG